MSTLVGLDVGTTGVKAVAISPDGEVFATEEEHYSLSTPHPERYLPGEFFRAASAPNSFVACTS